MCLWMISRCNGGAGITSLNNRRLPPASSASGRAALSRLTLSRQNSLRAQSTVVGTRLALRRVSLILAGSRSPGSPDSAAGSFGKTLDASMAASSAKTDSDTTSTPHDEADDEDDDVRLLFKNTQNCVLSIIFSLLNCIVSL